MSNKVQIVCGGLYGSESKGSVAAWLVENEQIDIAVRTGATNAGHTAFYNGQKYTMQQLPTAWVRPETTLVIGAGALVDPIILRREIEMVNEATGEDVRDRLLVDHRAYIHERWHARESANANRHQLIGATGKGCSQVLISRLQLRGQQDHRICELQHILDLGDIHLEDTEAYLNDQYDKGAKIQLEGTQGQLLDLVLGPYPYTTHKQTGPAQWMLEAGLSPALPTDIVMVVRTFPIRVAGNSGPLSNEISWVELARELNGHRDRAGLPPIVEEWALSEFEATVARLSQLFEIPEGSNGNDQHTWSEGDRVTYKGALSDLYAKALSEVPDATRQELAKLFEMTTVTKKLRRIARQDPAVLRKSARQIRPHRVVLTFLNYLYPERWCTDDPLTHEEDKTIGLIEEACGAPIFLANRGPLPDHFIKVPLLRREFLSSTLSRAIAMGEVG